MAEIEEDEREETKSGPLETEGTDKDADGSAMRDGRSMTPTKSPLPRPAREKKPNAIALMDVARFQLADELPPGYTGRGPSRWYYTKPRYVYLPQYFDQRYLQSSRLLLALADFARPGLGRFLDDMEELFEMHVYTMGTRSYADAICAVIDPAGSIFGGRILSRDESRSMLNSRCGMA